MPAIAGIDVDEDGADLGGGELGDGPLGAVGRPDAHALALRHPEGHQRPRAAVDVVAELAVRVAHVLVSGDEGLVVGDRATIASNMSPMVAPRSGVSLVPLT